MKNKIKEYILITIGFLILAVSIKFFLAPNRIAAGGISGIAIILNYFVPKISVGLFMFSIDIVLFIIAFLVIGSKFGAKTLYTSLGLSGTITILDKFIPREVAVTHDLFLATLFGTFISGIGMGIVFNQDSSTGGTDIVAKILNKFFNINIGKALLVVDFVVAIFGGVIFGSEIGMYGIVSVVLNGFIIDQVIEGLNKCKSIMVISSKNDIINKYIIEDLKRGCTILKGIGSYSGNNVEVLYTVLERKEFIKLKTYIKKVDSKAFIVINEAHEVLGEGFKNILEN